MDCGLIVCYCFEECSGDSNSRLLCLQFAFLSDVKWIDDELLTEIDDERRKTDTGGSPSYWLLLKEHRIKADDYFCINFCFISSSLIFLGYHLCIKWLMTKINSTKLIVSPHLSISNYCRPLYIWRHKEGIFSWCCSPPIVPLFPSISLIPPQFSLLPIPLDTIKDMNLPPHKCLWLP